DFLENGSVVVFDRGYISYAWWKYLDRKGLYFVSRTKSNARIDVLGQHTNPSGSILSDEKVLAGEFWGMQKYGKELRRIKYLDKETGEIYSYITNNFELKAEDVALIYKERWQIELFFKWIKQNLKIKTFLGTSKNAVLSQIWVAMIYYLLLAYIKFQTKFGKSLLELTRMVKETLFRRINLIDMLSLTARTIHKLNNRDGPQLCLL
ncbi:MAG: IS4 family transposase, partial [Patescibacteria group bacterium]